MLANAKMITAETLADAAQKAVAVGKGSLTDEHPDQQKHPPAGAGHHRQ